MKIDKIRQWQQLESDHLDPNYTTFHPYFAGDHSCKIRRAKLLWAREVIRCWWADRLPVPKEPS